MLWDRAPQRHHVPEKEAAVQSLSVSGSADPWTAARRAPLPFTVSQSLLKFMSTELVTLSIHLTLCHPFSFCLQPFPASGSFPMCCFFIASGRSISVLVSVSVIAMNIQGCFPLGFAGLVTLLSKGLSRVFSSTTI